MFSLSIIKRVAEAVFNALRPSIRTHVIGQVVSYDPEANTAVIQPVLKIIRGTDVNNMTTLQSALLSDVPVRQYGSGKLWVTIAPAVGSYGFLHISDRAIDGWLSAGGIVEPTSTRTHDLSDAVFEPSLTPLIEDGDNGAFSVAVATDRVSLRTRSGDTQVSVLEDESIEITTTGTVTLDNGSTVLTLDGSSVSVGSGFDAVAMATKTDDKVQAIVDAISNAATTPMDGGAAFKAAIVAAVVPTLASIGSVMSTNLNAD